jgi:hypothetical protein
MSGAFSVIGSVRVYGAPERIYRVAHGGADGLDFVLVEAAPGEAQVQSIVGPYPLRALLAHADRVLAGEPRAMTRPDSQKMLALGLVALEQIIRNPNFGPSPASEGLPDREPSEPSPPEVPPGSAANGQGGRAVHSHPGAPDQPGLFGGAPQACNSCGG